VSHKARELELLAVTAFAAVPLYFTGGVGPAPLIAFHAVLALMIARVASGRSAEVIPEQVMRVIAIAYVPLYIFDAVINHAIAASTHLVLFIAVYQPVESIRRNNHSQRLLTAALIFVASLATATDITIVLFVVVFAFLMFRQMMLLSHIETAHSIGRDYDEAPSKRAAAFYLAGTGVLAALLFPVIPRVRNPIVRGVTGALTNATSGLSNTIDFNQERSSTPDPSVVARVWMGPEAIPFFTPIRLRGNVYDRYDNNIWAQSPRGFRDVSVRDGAFRIARPVGFTRSARMQQRFVKTGKLFLPTGTFAVSGLTMLGEGPARDTYMTMTGGREQVTFAVALARETQPLRAQQPRVIAYPASPQVEALARSIVGTRTDAAEQARAIEQYMERNFRYYMRPEQIGKKLTVDEFLLHDRRGHCEYFAAGMAALLSTLHQPARVIGGYYGGRLNPLTGYFVVRNEDAHAWVEVWTGSRWETFDPTPPSMRPGNTSEGLLKTYVTALNDSVNYFWDRYILTYGLGDQIAFAADLITRLRDAIGSSHAALSRTAKAFTLARLLDVLLAIAAAVALIVLIRRRRRGLFDDLAGHLRRHGIEVGQSMTMEEALQQLREEQPDAARDLAPLILMYEEERFSARRERGRIATIRRTLARL
jgi:hypothetical protein